MRVAIDARMITYSGIGMYIKNTISCLARISQGHRFAVLLNAKDKCLVEDSQNITTFTPSKEIPVYSLKEQTRLPFEMKRLLPDIIHYPSFNMPLVNFRPVVVTIHDLIYYIRRSACPGLPAYGYAKLMFNAAARIARKIITVSEYTKGDIVRHLRISPEKVTVVYNGVDPVYRPVNDRERLDAVRKKYNIKADYILYVGNHMENKNLLRLIHAFAKLKGRPETQLVMAGKIDPRRERLYRAPVELGMEDRVMFIGAVKDDDLPALYSGAAVFVFPSLYEGFGLPPLEAMACGAPVVSSNAASLPEVVGDAALSFDPLDTEAIARSVERVLASKDLREELRVKGLKRATLFSWEAAAQKTLEVYDSALKM